MKNLFLITLLCFYTGIFAQDKSVHDILIDQVEAFNAKNIETLVANVSEDFKWYYIGSDTLLLEVDGKENFQKSMIAYYNSLKEVKSEITEYAIEQNRINFKEVVQYETKSGHSGQASSMGIYEMKNGLIHRVWYFY